MHALKLALGSSCYHTQGGTAETVEAFVSARTLAEHCSDVAGQLRAVPGTWRSTSVAATIKPPWSRACNSIAWVCKATPLCP